MDIVVIGAGALGAYFGARFQQAGANVSFLVREKRFSQMKKNGIRISSTQGDYHLQEPKLILSPDEIESCDFVLLSVKGYHLSGTFDHVKALVDKGAYVLPVLNGIEHIRTLQDYVGKSRVLGGLASIMATLDDNGNVLHTSPFHDLFFGTLQPEQREICDRMETFLLDANINSRQKEDILRELWKKYMFIHAFSAVTTAVNMPIGPIREHEETFNLVEFLLQEVKLLANAYHVSLTEEDFNEAREKILALQDDATTSMHQDRRKGNTLELDHIHGGAVRLAAKAGLKMPYTRAIYGIIKPYELV
jgi:2-dehydropantoate 2-reductase